MPEHVAIVKGDDAYEAAKKALRLLKFSVKNKKVLIKPNLCVSASSSSGVTTDAGVCRAVLERMKGCEAVIGESNGLGDVMKAFRKNGYSELAKDFDCGLKNLDRDEIVWKNIPRPFAFDKLPFARTAIECNYLISAAKLKVHGKAGVTVSLKNMFGCVPLRKNKLIVHAKIQQGIADLCQVVYPHFCIVDGIVGNEREEVLSNPVKHGIVLAGHDALSVDITAARCMGIEPDAIEHIRNMARLLGKPGIVVKGERIENVTISYSRKKTLITRMRYSMEGVQRLALNAGRRGF